MYTEMPQIVHLIAGFRRTGKDTLHHDLASGNVTYSKRSLHWCDYTWIPLWIMFLIRMITLGCRVLRNLLKRRNVGNVGTDCRWLVFSNRTNAIRANQEYLFVTRDRQRIAFADAMKREVHERIRAGTKSKEPLDDAWFEKNKEHPIRIGNTMTTPREMYIAHGEGAKRRDPIIWVRKCFDSFACKIDNPTDARSASFMGPHGGSEIIDITDWRFECEQIYAMLYAPIYRIFTTRIFRSEALVPDGVASEHGLDRVTTDLLLVPNHLDMIFALIRWPRYSHHMHIGTIY